MGPAGTVAGVEHLGAPVAYLVLPTGVPVYDRDGTHVGTVEHVLADEGADIFHGLVIRAHHLMDRPLFADREQVGGLYEQGVTLTVPATDLHEPNEDAIAADVTDASVSEQAREGLRRAWEWLSRPQ